MKEHHLDPEPWKKKKRRPIKLKIDARVNGVPPTGPILDKRQSLLSELKAKIPRGAGTTHFIPSHKLKRHPQLEKIEQYFVCLNFNKGRLSRGLHPEHSPDKNSSSLQG